MSRLRVPEEEGGILVSPPLSEVSRLLDRSRSRLHSVQRTQARAEVIGASADDLVVMGGHQPELFHPGVWLKNFALHGIARAHHAHSVNLVIDNDAARTAIDAPVVRAPLPAIEEYRPQSAAIPLDQVAPGLPCEEWTVRDEKFFRALPERIEASSFTPGLPFLRVFWEEVCRQQTANVPERLAGARRTFERRWGCDNLEVPISTLCRSEAFARFATHILNDLPRFHEVFNGALRVYRKAHHLKGLHHPFPELVRDGDWIEAPFWTWSPGATVRSRLFVRPIAGGFALRQGPELTGDLVSAWMRLEQAGVKVRCRALTVTLFARLFLADLFVHGIGGAKYDAVTDDVIEFFYGMAAPPFLVVSGTLRLPLPVYPVSIEDVRRGERLKRDLEFNPQRHLAEDAQTQELLAQRREWVQREPTDHAGRRERWRMLRRLNEQLTVFLDERKLETVRTVDRLRAEVEANALLRRRDWAFCLYPEELLRRWLTRFDWTS